MAYATPDQLATALRIQVNAANQELLDFCLESAAGEIDYELDRLLDDPLPDPPPAIVVRTNVNRAVEWYKSADAAYGIVGFEQVGLIYAPKDGFARHAVNLESGFKQQFGIA